MKKFTIGQKVRTNHPSFFGFMGVIISEYPNNYYRNKNYVVKFEQHFQLKGFMLGIMEFPFNEKFLEPMDERTVTFFYEKNYDEAPKRRMIRVTDESADYIAGLDVDDGESYKKFLKEKIVGPIKEVK